MKLEVPIVLLLASDEAVALAKFLAVCMPDARQRLTREELLPLGPVLIKLRDLCHEQAEKEGQA